MTVIHKDLTEANLHETKGVSTASADTVHIRASAGTSGWAKITKANIDTTSILNTNLLVLNVHMADISTASSVYVVAPFAGEVVAIYSAISGAITGADATITPKIGGSTMTSGAITIAYTASAAGDVDGSLPTANNVVTAGQAITLETDGASTGTVSANFSIVIEMS